ncbi:MAG: hypothetical protein ACREDR_48670, partial [Blastocatellia bacterium]
ARLGRHRGPASRPVAVDGRVGRVHPGKQPRVYPPDHQTRPRVHAGPQGPGPLPDTLYARLMRCGNLACTGRPFTEHRNVPTLAVDPADLRPAKGADRLHEMIPVEGAGSLGPVQDLTHCGVDTLGFAVERGAKPGREPLSFVPVVDVLVQSRTELVAERGLLP